MTEDIRLKRWCNRNTARKKQSRLLQTVWWKYPRRWGYWKWNKRWRRGNKCDFRARNHVLSPTPFYIRTSITISILQRMLQLSQTDVTATMSPEPQALTYSRLHSSTITTTLRVSDMSNASIVVHNDRECIFWENGKLRYECRAYSVDTANCLLTACTGDSLQPTK